MGGTFLPMHIRVLGRLLLIFFLLLSGACTLAGESLRRSSGFVTAPGSEGLPRVSTFLALKESPSPAMRLEISQLEILSADVWLPLLREAMVLDASSIGAGQVLLGGTPLMTGRYHRLRLTVTAARVHNAAGEWTELLGNPQVLEIPLGTPLELAADDSHSLFLTWDVQASLGADSFSPVFTAFPAVKDLLLDLLYVSCPKIDTIFVIRTDTNRVVDSFGVRGGPTWMATDANNPAERLYVLTPGERMVKVVDLATYRIVDFFPAPLNDLPNFMTLDPHGQAAYLLDERSGYLSRMDLSSGRIVARVSLGLRPQFAIHLEQQNLLAVSQELAQKVLLLDPVSLSLRGSFTTGSRPQGFTVNANQLYVAESGDNAVSVFDLGSRASRDRITVNFGPSRLLSTGSQIYVSHEAEGMLSVLVPGQLGVVQEIHDLGMPSEMAYQPFFGRLYVVDREYGGVSVVDVNADLLVERISLGALPFGLVVPR